MPQHNVLEVKRGETPTFYYEIFQEEEGGPRVDLTGAVIVVSSDIPGASSLSYAVTDAPGGTFTVSLTEAATLAMRKFQRYCIRVHITTANADIHIIDLEVQAL